MKWVGFFSKGVNAAGQHTKAVVTAKRIQHENHQRQKEMDRHFHQMGKLFYEARVGRLNEVPDTHMRLCVERIRYLEKEIEKAQKQIDAMTIRSD